MSTWYNRVVSDLTNIVPCINHFEQELLQAQQDVKVSGVLEKASAELPGITAHRFNQLQEIEAILEHLNIQLKQERSRVFRRYMENYARALTSREAEKYVDGDAGVVDLAELVNQFSLLRNRYLGIYKGLEVKNWHIGHIIKLRSMGIEDAAI